MANDVVVALAPHQQRVVDEKRDLDGKLAKLTAFLRTELFLSLDARERERLTAQRGAMALYSFILGERIAAWGP